MERPEYPPFTRDGHRYSVEWVFREPGDAVFDVTNDSFLIVLEPYWDLTVHPMAAAVDAPKHEGKTPKEIGLPAWFTDPARVPPLGEMPRWLSEKFGIGGATMSHAIKEILRRQRK